jgi:anthranilate synthase component 1
MHLIYDLKQLEEWAQAGFNLLPVSMQFSGDLMTPVAAFTRLKAVLGGDCFLLESAAGGEQVGRFSFVGLRPFQQVRLRDHTIEITTPSGKRELLETAEPHRALEAQINKYKAPFVRHLPPLQGGMVGYVSYDAIRYWEPIPLPQKTSGFDDALLSFFDTIIAFDHLRHVIHCIAHVRPEEESLATGLERIANNFGEVVAALASATPVAPLPHAASQPKPQGIAFDEAMLGADHFKLHVKRLKKHIRDGDIFQCVLSDRFRVAAPEDPFLVYRMLRMINPSPYLYYLEQGDQVVLGASPEMLVKVQQGHIATCPIAGTRPRGENEAEDQKRENELLASVKERAEHLMLVDLGRNDIGRLAVPGTVTVPEYMKIERFSHVMHLVSRVIGKLPPKTSAWRALEACFPAGTLTGAPKIRAMQIISELEPERRGPYGGAIICQDFSNNMNSCIAIRSLFISGKQAFVQAGAGIVADSQAEREYQEIHNKAKVVATALNLAAQVRG